MDKLSIKSLNALCRDCERFSDKVLKLALKIRKNPHRGDYIPSIEQTSLLQEEQGALIQRLLPFEMFQDHLQQLMKNTDGLMKNLYIITMAQKDLHDKLEQQRVTGQTH